MAYTIQSPLKAWEGSLSLPDPDEFNRVHWDVWKAAVNKPKRKPYALIHLYSYAGLELVQRFGEWNLGVPLAEVRAWEDNPEAEKVKLVAWLGKELRQYIDDIIDPKE
jgi:hypothetical protein